MRTFAMTGIETAAWIPSIMLGSDMRATPPSLRMSAGTRSSAMTETAPAASAILACSGVTTSMMTPPFSISARPVLTRRVAVSFTGRTLAMALRRSDEQDRRGERCEAAEHCAGGGLAGLAEARCTGAPFRCEHERGDAQDDREPGPEDEAREQRKRPKHERAPRGCVAVALGLGRRDEAEQQRRGDQRPDDGDDDPADNLVIATGDEPVATGGADDQDRRRDGEDRGPRRAAQSLHGAKVNPASAVSGIYFRRNALMRSA